LPGRVGTIDPRTLIKATAAFLLVLIPPLVFEKYTFYLYSIFSPDFFGYSGRRFWFDIGWFVAAGALSAIIVGRKKRASLFAPVAGAAAFTAAVYFPPFCVPKECYVSSTDGLGALRDLLFFASLGVLACNATLSSSGIGFRAWHRSTQIIYLFLISMLMGYALSFFPLVHIFAGVSVPYPLNYLQWFLACAVPSFAASFLFTERTRRDFAQIRGVLWFLGGLSGVLFGIALDFSLPCEACSGYAISIGSILLVAVVFSSLGILAGKIIVPTTTNTTRAKRKNNSTLVMTFVIIGTVVLLIAFYYTVSYEASVVNIMGPSVTNTSFSPLEIGSTFVYSGGYLKGPEVRPAAVGVSLSFGNSTISKDDGSISPLNFLAAGVGDQSPNCCTDGIDLAYRADAVLFTNGTEALIARSWLACDVNMACGGYSWQQLLHYGEYTLPQGTLSNWVDLQMNWTSPTLVGWYYRVHYSNNASVSPWIMYNSFVPPKIDNHYFDAGQCCGNVLFYQFGVSSAREINTDTWSVIMKCPMLIENGTWTCLQHAGFIGGQYSFWKIVYTWGASYSGLDFNYLGNYTVRFYFSGSSPTDGTMIW
jgi:hypothetical protein